MKTRFKIDIEIAECISNNKSKKNETDAIWDSFFLDLL